MPSTDTTARDTILRAIEPLIGGSLDARKGSLAEQITDAILALRAAESLPKPTSRYDLETSIVDTLSHAATIGRMQNWREAAREFQRVLALRGYVMIPAPGDPDDR